MRILSYIIISVFILLSCNTTKNVAESKNKKLGFKKVVEAMYSPNENIENRDLVLKEKITEITYYDRNGDVMEYHNYEVDGTLWRITKITRDKNGKPLKGVTTDSKGQLLSYWTTKIDSMGNITEYYTFNSKNELTDIQKSKFDKKGNEIELVLEVLDFGYTNRTKFRYNALNQLIEMEDYNGAQNKTEIRTYKYDKKGNEIEELLTRDDGSMLLFNNEYDKNSNLISNKWFEEGEQTHETSFSYVYDYKGNWITKKRSSNGKLGLIWERKIEYY